ncbi:MAG TPA: CBS domain-containing protein [Gemmataceae bacterium]|nr:CBS domain-containing protein [Gemmataceae bacterium]
MPTVRDILAHKGSEVAAISPEATIYEAAVRMNERKIGSLAVLHDGRLYGIITERDILQRVVAARRDPSQTPVSEVMTTEVVCCQLHTSLDEARGVMKNRRIRHLPVLNEEGLLLGMVSIGDLNAHEANTQEQTIHLLHEYIYGHV